LTDRLVRLRRELPALRSRAATYGDAFPGNRVFAYLRHGPPEAAALVVLNFGEATGAELLMPEGVAPSGTLLRDHIEGDTLRIEPGGRLELPAWTARVLTTVEE
jgi:hypothetical protein